PSSRHLRDHRWVSQELIPSYAYRTLSRQKVAVAEIQPAVVGGQNCEGRYALGRKEVDIAETQVARGAAADGDDAVGGAKAGPVGGGVLQDIEALEPVMVRLVEDHAGAEQRRRMHAVRNGLEIGARGRQIDRDDEVGKHAAADQAGHAGETSHGRIAPV